MVNLIKKKKKKDFSTKIALEIYSCNCDINYLPKRDVISKARIIYIAVFTIRQLPSLNKWAA